MAETAGAAVSFFPQHFGFKAELFETTLTEAMSAIGVLFVPSSRPVKTLIYRALTDDDTWLPVMIILSIGETAFSEIAGRIIRVQIVPGLAKRLGPPNSRSRAMKLQMISTGFLFYARQPQLERSEFRPSETSSASCMQPLVSGRNDNQAGSIREPSRTVQEVLGSDDITQIWSPGQFLLNGSPA